MKNTNNNQYVSQGGFPPLRPSEASHKDTTATLLDTIDALKKPQSPTDGKESQRTLIAPKVMPTEQKQEDLPKMPHEE